MRLRMRAGRARKLLLAIPLLTGGTVFAFGTTHVHGIADSGSCPTQNQKPANPSGSVEALLANLSPAAGSEVQPGSTIQLLYTDEQPIASSTTSTPSPTVTIDGSPVTPSVQPTSGVTPTYVQPSDGGSQGTQCQDTISIQVPSNISSGNHTASITAYDSDNNLESFTWTFSTPTPPPGIVTSQSLLPNDEGFVANGEGATGTMTFKLFRPDDQQCTGTPVFTQTVKVSNGTGNTSNTTFIATQQGAYRWLVTYSGDKTHPPAKSPCGFEYFRIDNNNPNNT